MTHDSRRIFDYLADLAGAERAHAVFCLHHVIVNLLLIRGEGAEGERGMAAGREHLHHAIFNLLLPGGELGIEVLPCLSGIELEGMGRKGTRHNNVLHLHEE